MLERTGALPTIPEYYKQMINSSVDLALSPKQCCPFHQEDTPSFSYNGEKGIWRCFGACKCGGDVIDLHKKNYHLRTRQEAENSLNALCGIMSHVKLETAPTSQFINVDKVESEILYQKALLLANNPDRWDELDYLMSKVPIDYISLQELINRWEGIDPLVDTIV